MNSEVIWRNLIQFAEAMTLPWPYSWDKWGSMRETANQMVNLETPISDMVPGRKLVSEKRPKGKSLIQKKDFASRGRRGTIYEMKT